MGVNWTVLTKFPDGIISNRMRQWVNKLMFGLNTENSMKTARVCRSIQLNCSILDKFERVSFEFGLIS